jgi:hypothetical protein
LAAGVLAARLLIRPERTVRTQPDRGTSPAQRLEPAIRLRQPAPRRPTRSAGCARPRCAPRPVVRRAADRPAPRAVSIPACPRPSTRSCTCSAC